MKKFFLLLLCTVLSATFLVSCTAEGDKTSGSVSGSVSGTDSAVSDATGSSDTSGTEDKNASQVWDTELDHTVIMDDSGTKILVADLNHNAASPEEIVVEDCIIWEWDSAEAEGAKLKGADIRIDSARLRYSEYWKKDVVVFCGSGGWVGVIDYDTKEVLFEDKPENGPHSAELLPNGDLVLACSGNNSTADGCVLYYPLSSGTTKAVSTIGLESAHGVCYDPTNDVIWALGGKKIIACSVSNGKMTAVGGMEVSLGESGGHDLSPVYGQPGKYWVSTGKRILLFDANELTVTSSFSRASDYTGSNVKGIAYFADGTMIQTAHDQGGTGTYRSSVLRILYTDYSSGKVKNVVVKEAMVPHREGSQTYKIHVFTKDYQ